jgi:hypothetical protein
MQINDGVNAGSNYKNQIAEEFGIAPTTLSTIWTNGDKILEAMVCGDLSPKRKNKFLSMFDKRKNTKQAEPFKSRSYFKTILLCNISINLNY